MSKARRTNGTNRTAKSATSGGTTRGSSGALPAQASPAIDRATILTAAAKIGCSPPVAEKILRLGADAARNRVHRERGQDVRYELGLDQRP